METQSDAGSQLASTAGQLESNQLEADQFQRRLDELLVAFRSDTLQHYLGSKQQLSIQQAQTIDAERRRCTTMLSLKQSEVEQLKENLAIQTKQCDEYKVRTEMMAVWSCQGKTIGRIRTLQLKCFFALKKYWEFKRHSKIILADRAKHNKQLWTRQVFQAWVRHHQAFKKEKQKQRFDLAVKNEVQLISASYQKEIEMLRQKLEDANN